MNVPHLPSRRKHGHIGVRAGAELIDLVIIAVVGNVIISEVGALGPFIVFGLLILYFTVLETHSGQTLGKRVLGIRVVNSTGQDPSIGQSVIRNLIRPFEAFGLLGVILISSTSKGQRIGDLIAATYVVHVNELQLLAQTEAQIASNETESSRQIVPLTTDALSLDKTLIADAYKPAETGLTITADTSATTRLIVQLDFIDASDDSWHYTTDGVTISVPRNLAEQCDGLRVSTADGKLVVERVA